MQRLTTHAAYLAELLADMPRRVVLADLSDEAGLTPEYFAQAVLELQEAGRIALMKSNNPADRSANRLAIHINGCPRHLAYQLKETR